jgi:hypothetical protein
MDWVRIRLPTRLTPRSALHTTRPEPTARATETLCAWPASGE